MRRLLAIWRGRRRPIAVAAALLLIVNQRIPGAVHRSRRETDAMTQNAIIIPMFALVFALVVAVARKQTP
ncbi:hypothetical protein [Rhizorhabdus sp. FW153]|uniref:hypothetical protein n=1 Tax=Rhizorhabdus sp. FW153 TaxID=3400216 RepID=UPI003CF6C00C